MSGGRALVLGATGTVGRAVALALRDDGFEVVCPVRPRAGPRGAQGADETTRQLAGCMVRFGDPLDPAWLSGEGFGDEPIDVVISCLASRTGAPRDAWAVDHVANLAALTAAKAAGVPRFILVSAICVQKPRLAFQHAKLAFEAALMQSGLEWVIVRPTALFKSLSGQVDRVRSGKPFLVFGDGELTRCKPISDGDLGRFVARCAIDPTLSNRVLPIGGPGPAITPREQGERLFELLGRPPRFTRVPVAMMDGIIGGLGLAGRLSRRLADRAEFARIGRYYATELMLVWNQTMGRYDEAATPETGSERLFDHYAKLLTGEARTDLGEHAAF